jgi:hypothetical protein
MAPPPPGRLTTVIVWEQSFSFSMTDCIIRAMMSLPPPGAAWQTNSMGLLRNFWAWDSAGIKKDKEKKSAKDKKSILSRFIEFPP